MTLEQDRAEKAKAYFGQPGFQRMLQAVWRKYASLERIGGTAVLERATETECEAINTFFGWDYKTGDTVPVPLSLFDLELGQSVFAMDLLELHDLLEGATLLTKTERKRAGDKQWVDMFNVVRGSMEEPLSGATEEWLNRLMTGDGAGIRTLQEQYKSDPQLAINTLIIVVRVLNLLFVDGNQHAPASIRLPVLAARVSGDAHALDMDRPAGRLLVSCLKEKLAGITGLSDRDVSFTFDGGGDGSSTLKLRETYRSFGILDDDLSSIVYWYVPEPGQPVLPQVWTLRQTDAAETMPRCSRVYVVENPAVFSTLLDSAVQPDVCSGDPPALICTSGPASASAIRWLRRCLKVSAPTCMLYYSGDFDVKGVFMGQTLFDLFPERFIPWRFDTETFLNYSGKGFPGPQLDAMEQETLDRMSLAWDARLCKTMSLVGRKVYQELIVEQLVEDYSQRNLSRRL